MIDRSSSSELVRRTALGVLAAAGAAFAVFGPRGARETAGGRVVLDYWEKWTGVEGQAMQRIVEAVQHQPEAAVTSAEPASTAGIDQTHPHRRSPAAIRPTSWACRLHRPPLRRPGRPSGRSTRSAGRVRHRPGELAAASGSTSDLPRPLFALPSTGPIHHRPLRVLQPRRVPRSRPRPGPPAADPRRVLRVRPAADHRDADGRIVQAGFTPSMAMLGWWPWIWPCFFDGRLWDGQADCTPRHAGGPRRGRDGSRRLRGAAERAGR